MPIKGPEACEGNKRTKGGGAVRVISSVLGCRTGLEEEGSEEQAKGRCCSRLGGWATVHTARGWALLEREGVRCAHGRFIINVIQRIHDETGRA